MNRDEALTKITQERDDLLEAMREIYDVVDALMLSDATTNKSKEDEKRDHIIVLCRVHTLACIIGDYEEEEMPNENKPNSQV